MKRAVFVLCAVLLSGSHYSVYAEDNGTSYVDRSKSILAIRDVNRQADAWAMCAATYDLMADFLSATKPAQSQVIRNTANGAEVAVMMSILSDGLKPGIPQERFNALFASAKLASTERPKTSRNWLLAEAKSYDDKESNTFLKNLMATFAVCAKNAKAQQMYIDSWRELAKSGLLKFPDE